MRVCQIKNGFHDLHNEQIKILPDPFAGTVDILRIDRGSLSGISLDDSDFTSRHLMESWLQDLEEGLFNLAVITS